MSGGGELTFDRDGTTLSVRLAGEWRLRHGHLPPIGELERALDEGQTQRIVFDASGLADWDSSILTFVSHASALARARDIAIEREGLPEGAQRLLALAEAVPEKSDAREREERDRFLARVGKMVLAARDDGANMLAFLGELTVTLATFLRGRARYRSTDFFLLIQHAGADALPIVALISGLVGLILAFVGAVQLEQFGASIYVADLVGIGMAREMGAMMTAIVMAGRTGAAFAAQLGAMKANQEIDALRTLGISPMEFLVLPRVVALCIMMPLLCLYSDLMGILGGSIVGTGMLGIAPLTYARETFDAISLGDVAGGVFKAAVYGSLVAFSGCLRGMQSGNSSSAVGEATTSAVVTGIVLIICASGLFSVVFYVLGI